MNALDELGGTPAAPGTVYLVGSGPGAPGLVTARAAKLLSTATFVAYDRLASAEARALCRPECEQVFVGKRPDYHALKQDGINDLLVEKAKEGHAVVRFKGGDPFVFGRGSEEALRCLEAGVPFEVVPGISSSVAAPAFAGIPVTHRGLAHGFAVITGHEDPDGQDDPVNWPNLATFPGTLCVLMGVAHLEQIARGLMKGGKPADTPVALVRWGTLSRQAVLRSTLGEVADEVERQGFRPPAVTVIGPVAALADQLTWFTDRPLHGRRVLVPRTRQDSSVLATKLRALGADVVIAPTIEIMPASDPEPMRNALNNLKDYAAIALTSRNAVRALFNGLADEGFDSRALAGLKLVVVGPGTAEELASNGVMADLIAPRATAEALARAISSQPDFPRDKPILAPLADIAGPTLAAGLRENEFEVNDVEAYRTVPAESLPPGVAEDLAKGRIDAVACSSSSTIRNLVGLCPAGIHESVKLVAIGPSTEATIMELGFTPDAVAHRHDVDGLVAALIETLTGDE